jgi:uncharacterized protein YqfA (UPF0365 family)
MGRRSVTADVRARMRIQTLTGSAQMENEIPLIFRILFVVLVATFFVALGSFFSVWIRARLSGAPIPLETLVGMRLKGIPLRLLVDAAVTLRHSGQTVGYDELESVYLAERYSIRRPQDLINVVRRSHTK